MFVPRCCLHCMLLLLLFGHLFYWLTVNKLINFYDQTPSPCCLEVLYKLPPLERSFIRSLVDAFIHIPRGIVLIWTRSEWNIKSSRLTSKKTVYGSKIVLSFVKFSPVKPRNDIQPSFNSPVSRRSLRILWVCLNLDTVCWMTIRLRLVLSSVRQARFNLRRKFNGFTNSNKMVNNVISISGYSNL